MRLIPTIPTVPHTFQSVHYCQRCDYYKNIYRIWKVCAQGGLERPLELSGTSYKWLSHRGIHPSSGPIIQFLKKTSFVQDSRISYWLQLVCSISPLLLYGFQSNLVSLESYFRGESNAVCCKGRGLLLMENVGNYRNCATRIILEILVHITSGFLLSGHSPSRLGCSPSILHRWKWSLVWIQGRNMGLVSRILRV